MKLLMLYDSPKKHSVVYKAQPGVENPPITSLYLMRSAFPSMPQVIEVEITIPTVQTKELSSHAQPL